MKTINNLFTAAAFIGFASVASAANIAIGATGIIGHNDGTDLTTLGTAYFQTGVGGTAATLNDGLNVVITDTWNGAGAESHQYVGVTGFTIAAGDEITSLTVDMNNFSDGGWFGDPTTNTLTAIEPTLQTSTNGTDWVTLAGVSSDYATTVGGLSTFSFAGVTGVTGMRLIGTGGGLASAGFIGVSEITIETTAIVPEPSSTALLGLSGLALILRRRK